MTCNLWGTALHPALHHYLSPGSSSGETGTGNESHAKVQLLLRTLQSSPALASSARGLNLEAAGAADYRITIIEPLIHHSLASVLLL